MPIRSSGKQSAWSTRIPTSSFDCAIRPLDLEYVDIKREVLELLHDEAMKSFATGAVNAADFLEAYSQLGQDQAQPRMEGHK